MPSYLITGSSRGLGLGFVTELLKNASNTVIATARNTAASPGLQELKKKYPESTRLALIDMDVTKPESVKKAVEATSRLLPGGLDYLVSNAGVGYNVFTSIEDLDFDELKDEVGISLSTHTLVIKSFLPLIRKGQEKKILVLSSVLASLDKSYYMPVANSYSIARAALNMLIRKWSATLKNGDITTVLVHPGWVGETEIGSSIAPFMEKAGMLNTSVPVAQSAADLMGLLNGFTAADNGLFYNHDGTQIPW